MGGRARRLAALVRPGGLGLVAEGFWRRAPSADSLERLGGASADELPGGLPELEAGARAAGWEHPDGKDTLGFALLTLRKPR